MNAQANRACDPSEMPTAILRLSADFFRSPAVETRPLRLAMKGADPEYLATLPTENAWRGRPWWSVLAALRA